VSSYSKTKVDRAGRLLADQISHLAEDPKHLPESAVLGEAQEAIAVIEWWRSEHAKPLSRVAANLRHYVRDAGEPVVAQRLKRVPTIAGKLLREPAMKLSRMADIGGVRAILPNQTAAYRIAGRLRRNWTITRNRDYVAEPKADGYRALHLVSRHRGRLIEIQLRTPLQDDWANLVEKFSRSLVPGLKFGEGPSELKEFFLLLGEFNAAEEQGISLPQVKIARLRELLNWVDTFVDEHDESG
jgi:putative GTP pyrophosphokinase